MSEPLSEFFKKVFKLQNIKQGEKVIIASSSVFNTEQIEAYTTALNTLGADILRVMVPQEAIKGRDFSKWYWDVYKTADMILVHRPCESYREWNAPSALPHYASGFVETLGKGIRILDLMLPEKVMRKQFPTEDLIKRVKAARELMEKAEEIHVTSEAGTDFTISKKGRTGNYEIGVSDTPGRWDNFGFGCVSTFPVEDSANGTLVLDPPSLMSHVGFVIEPTKLTLKNGYITKIEGGSTACALNKWLGQYNDKESYGTSHIGWGMHKKAAEMPEYGASPRELTAHYHNAYGSMLIAFGMNKGMEDGKRVAPSHIDIGVFNVDFKLDDELVVSRGKVLPPECR